MMEYKHDYDCYYSDTDSIFISKPLPDNLIGSEIGQFKNELLEKCNPPIIKQAYFLGIKQYAYWYYDKNNNKIEKSVIAGVQRDTIPFNHIIDLYNGKPLEISINNRFIKSFKYLDIKIRKDFKLNLQFNPSKQLLNNEYIPITINNKE